ncbi:MAG: ATP synthase F1 subunit gamma [Patescibacteria group bacterium]|nr:ATP synthase F1 subunit gamma [Patescibacteria group bacterium]
MASTKEIQRRIKSIGNTKKITKAMEMVSAAKMRKTIEAVLKTRSYANLSWMTVLNIASAVNAGDLLHPLLEKRKKIRKEAIVLITSNRGLCGSFNSAIIQKAVASVKKHQVGRETDFILLGKKGLSVKSRYNHQIAADFIKEDVAYEAKEVAAIGKMIINDYLSGKYDKVLVAYTDFMSPVKQIPRVKQILPIDFEAKDQHLGIVGRDPRVGLDVDFVKQKEDKYLRDEEKNSYIFKYEPSTEIVLNEMLPRLIEVQLFQALLESNASEHSARMASMHKATDAAKDLVSELTLYYNKARQAAITREISEISAGVSAMNN